MEKGKEREIGENDTPYFLTETLRLLPINWNATFLY